MITRIVLLLLVTLSLGRAKTILCPTCSQDDFENAVYSQASPGDIIVLPAGSATWGNSSRANAGVIYITNSITVMGQGSSTVITLDDTGATYATGVIALWSASIFENMEIVGSNVNPVTAFQVAPYNSFAGGFRISNITYIGGTGTGYFAYVASGVNYGLIDSCNISSSSGSTELIFVRGPTNAWTTTSTFGGPNNIYVEACTFGGQGYVCDANSNARMVIRFCTINGQNKIDGHGTASNSPAQSVREVEAYDNSWTYTGGVWTAIEIRGGSAVIFDNTAAATGNNSFFFLTDYGYQAQWPNFNYTYQTPTNYPITEQIGTGNGGAAASQPAYVFHNFQHGSPWPRSFNTPQVLNMATNAAGYAVGATNIGVSPIGTAIYAGTYNNNTGITSALAIAGDSHRYLLASTAFATAQNLILNSPGIQTAIPAAPTAVTSGAVTLYQQQTGNASATFAESDLIKANRDFYADAGFDIAAGVTRGTTAQMNALTPSFVGYGFWVTDQGSWNANLPPNTSGQLYVWSGSSWVLAYTPYAYPHPLRLPVAPSNLILGP
jgi:hypothetical protein